MCQKRLFYVLLAGVGAFCVAPAASADVLVGDVSRSLTSSFAFARGGIAGMLNHHLSLADKGAFGVTSYDVIEQSGDRSAGAVADTGDPFAKQLYQPAGSIQSAVEFLKFTYGLREANAAASPSPWHSELDSGRTDEKVARSLTRHDDWPYRVNAWGWVDRMDPDDNTAAAMGYTIQTQAVPAPGAAALGLVGLAMVAIRRRRGSVQE